MEKKFWRKNLEKKILEKKFWKKKFGKKILKNFWIKMLKKIFSKKVDKKNVGTNKFQNQNVHHQTLYQH